MIAHGWERDIADQIFGEADINNDGDVSLHEWIVTFIDKKKLLTE